MKKIALITGITGQDGSFLAELLIKKGYAVHGIKRKSSQFNTQLVDHIYENSDLKNNFFLHYGDMTDGLTITKIIKKIKPTEIYNLAAQSHVAVSFENPEYISNVNALGTLRILESLRLLNLEKFTKFYQASTSEMFGDLKKSKLNENSNFIPKSPYGASKLFAYWITKIYRESYGIYACNGILFNHESERRGETFITRKITKGLSEIVLGKRNFIEVGNLNSKRDWGYANDYVKMQWLMLQQKRPDDYVIATGYQISVREFINRCCKYLNITIKWTGKGIYEKAIISKTNNYNLKAGKVIVRINKRYFRPNDVNSLIGDASKARKKLKWKPLVSVDAMIKKMIDNDMKLIKVNNPNAK
jgi:GDPmannose 4,6-dehydratase